MFKWAGGGGVLRCGKLALVAVLALLGSVALPAGAQATTAVTVTSTADTGGTTCASICTLRQAITAVDASGGGTIYFDIPGSGVQEIQPATALPAVTGPTSIDANTQPGYSGTPLIQLDGSLVTKKGTDGLLLESGNSLVWALEITDWNGAGIELKKGTSKTATTAGTQIDANYIGNDGSTAYPNGTGILIDGGSPNNYVGYTSSSDLNVISGNTGAGVELTGKGVTGNVVEGDYIGTDSTGKNALGNGYGGVDIVSGASGNTIGGTSAARDVISGNDPSGKNYDQVDIGAASGNFVEGDYIGPDVTGSAAIVNGADGIYLYDGAKNNTIGGAAPGVGDVISGNAYDGVQLDGSSTSGNMVEGDYIGTDSTGTSALGNQDAGVFLGDGTTHNTIGGTTVVDRNVISANNANPDCTQANPCNFDGIDFYKASDNSVEGNYIGTDDTGATALENYGDGIALYGGSTGNTIGGTTASARNVISGNKEEGVYMDETGTSKNVVEGDYVGTDNTGTKSLPNQGSGVYIYTGASGNIIGGTTSGAGNVISGNSQTGVALNHTSKNLVEGDYIGTDETGKAALGNGYYGIGIWGAATGNVIGGTPAGAGDVISGNTGVDGIDISEPGTTQNLVEGDYIGTDETGDAALPNFSAVDIFDGANGNIIGGTASGAENVLSGNSSWGVSIGDASKNVVEGDLIGTNNTASSPLGNGHDGVFIVDGSSSNVIGGTAKSAGNVIAANGTAGSYEGVELADSGTTKNLVEGNFIGTNVAGATTLGNSGDGVLVDNGADGNTIGGTAKGDANTIDYNVTNGVEVDGSSSTGDPIETNSIFQNTNLGIVLSGGDADEQPPSVTGITGSSNGKSSTIEGTLPSSDTKGSFRIEVFNNPSCAVSNPQGQTFLGATQVSGSATASKRTWKLTVPVSELMNHADLTATATDTKALDTSQFSGCFNPP